jgi:SAM-dependent methyltransferase
MPETAMNPAAEPGIAVFGERATRYDRWFDSARGSPIFASEVRALGNLAADLDRPWLEVGVGTGRFAQALGIDVGVEPAPAAARLAARERHVRTVRALGEAPPFGRRSFGTVFVIVTLCFAGRPTALLAEARRVAAAGGVVVGIVPAESRWGAFYRAEGARGHPFYERARFFSLDELGGLAGAAGLTLVRGTSTLLQPPDRGRLEPEMPRAGVRPTAGFVSLHYRAADEEAM